MPCQTISDEICFICSRDVWCLVVDGVVASEDGVVDHAHVACSTCEEIVLKMMVSTDALIIIRTQILTFLVRNIGVGINARGVSAHGLEEDGLVLILNRGKK